MKITGKKLDDIFRQFSCFIYANILRYDVLKKGIDPEDIFQEVRIKIWKLLKNEKNIKNYASYIKKIVDTSVIDYLRKKRREENIINLEKSSKISELKNLNIRNVPSKNISGEIIHEKIKLLLKSRQRVVELFFLGLSIEEISICLDWSQHKTRNLLYRGLADLRELIKSDMDRNE